MDNLLKNIPFISKLTSLFSNLANAGDNNRVLAIDIGSSSIKAVQLRKDKGKIVLETYGEIATAPYGSLAVGQSISLAPEKMAEVLGDIMREANVTAKNVALVIPSKSSLIVNVEIPEAARGDLSNIVPLESRKFVPVPISEVELDWWVIPDLRDKESVRGVDKKTPMIEVLVVAIHKDVIKQYQDVARKLGLNLRVFEIETFSAIRSVMRNDLSATAILDLGASTSKVAIVDYGVIRMAHTISKGAQDITMALSRSLNVNFAKAEEIKRKIGLVEEVDENTTRSMNSILEYIFTETNRVISAYQKKNQRAVEKLVIIGGGAMLKGLNNLVTNSFEIPIVFGHPFDRVQYPAFLQNVLREAGPVFSTAIGVGLREIEET